jgi:L-threonylcarbamoyladenylate synthase
MLATLVRAAAILRSGGLVAFPTETVYGLGADATNVEAVGRIFVAKGRPSTNPLICHVADEAMARRYAAVWPEEASKLAAAFWPGPLTLVLPRTQDIVPAVTARLDSVGLRAPDHPLTLQLLRIVDRPIAGPSANKSNHVSPTTADHVRAEFAAGEVDMILDGGPCTVGIESTVLDLAHDEPAILRPGGVSREQIESVIGPVAVKAGVVEASAAAMSPGQHPVHYAPRAPAYRFERGVLTRLPPGAVALVIGGALAGGDEIVLPAEPAEYARQFYAALRDLDAARPSAIYVELPPDAPQWLAVRDRILRATQPLP